VTIECLPFSAEADLTNATIEDGEPQRCGQISSSVWYRFDPTVPTKLAGRVDATFSVSFAIYTGGNLANLHLFSCGLYSPVSVVPGQTYFIQLGYVQDPLAFVGGGANLRATLRLEAVSADQHRVGTVAGLPFDGIPAVLARLARPSGVAADPEGNVYIADSFNGRVRKVDRRGVITTVAGNGTFGHSGEGGPATKAALGEPFGLAFGPEGDLYISDVDDDTVHKVDRRGVITRVAGSGERGFSGDGSSATQAGLNNPSGLALDREGNLYVADMFNNRVRRVDRAGIITTVAGNGAALYSGDGGPASLAGLSSPWGIATDLTGNLYITDAGNNRVRKVDRSGVISTVAGNGAEGFSGDGGAATLASLDYPAGVALDAEGDIYIADTSNLRVRRVDSSGVITTVAGNGLIGFSGDGGLASQASFVAPYTVAVSPKGNVYVGDYYDDRVRAVDRRGIIVTAVGNGLEGFSGDGGRALFATLNYSRGIAFDREGNLYIADTFNHRVRKVDLRGLITTVAGTGLAGFSGDGGPATDAKLYYPRSVALDPEGNLYVADTFNHRMRRVGRRGIITTVAGTGLAGFSGDGGPASQSNLNFPSGATVDSEGAIFIADTLNDRVRKVDRSGVITTVAGNGVEGFSGDGGPAILASLNGPRGLALDADGNLYFADSGNHRVRKVDQRGIITTVAGNGAVVDPPAGNGDGGRAIVASLSFPYGIASDTEGNLYIADTNHHRVRKVDRQGIISTAAGNGADYYGGDGGPALQASFYQPSGVALDSDGNLYIADSGNSRVRMVDDRGTITTVAGNLLPVLTGDGIPATRASLARPSDIALGPQGTLYIADTQDNRVRKVDRHGIITTVAGNGAAGFSGDGSPAERASLLAPSGVALDAEGNLFIADSGNNRVRRVDRHGIITTVAGNGARGFSGDGGSATLASLSHPTGVALDADGNLYIADAGNHRVRKVDQHGIITTVAGNGAAGYSGDGKLATQTRLANPRYVALDREGNLYIADTDNHRVRKVDHNGIMTTVAGNGSGIVDYRLTGDGGPAAGATLIRPSGITLDSEGNLYITDADNHRVRKVDRHGIITTVAGNGYAGFTGDGGPAGEASLASPQGVALDPDGNLYIADTGNGVVRVVVSLAVKGPPAPTIVRPHTPAPRRPGAAIVRRTWAEDALVPEPAAIAAPPRVPALAATAERERRPRPAWDATAALLALSVATALARQTRGAGRSRKRRGPGTAEPP
jgi:sugar lactone lactonase YvrE